jgi:hypothetical protein
VEFLSEERPDGSSVREDAIRSDCILFGGWQVTVSKEEKATGEERFMRAGTSGAVVAGNRYGLPDTIKAPAGAGNLWRSFADALKKAKTPAAAVPASKE